MFSHSHILLVFFCATGYVYSMTSLTLSNSSTKIAGNQISCQESYRIFLACIKCCAIASHNLLSRYIKTNIKSTSAFCKGNICRTVDSFIILIKTDRIRRKTILVQGRLVFFSPKDNIKQKKKFRHFSIVKLVTKNITPSSCRVFD